GAVRGGVAARRRPQARIPRPARRGSPRPPRRRRRVPLQVLTARLSPTPFLIIVLDSAAQAHSSNTRSFRRVSLMYLDVIHHISDPEGFQAAESKAIEQGLPANVQLPIHAATPDHTTGICIWQGDSVSAVRELVA